MRYEVYEKIPTLRLYAVEAESEEEAIKKVANGYGEIYCDYIEVLENEAEYEVEYFTIDDKYKF
mgnify:CR=1 FL=1